MTPADSSIPTKVLSIDHSFFRFFLQFSLHFFPFIIHNCNFGSLFRKDIKMKIFLLFTIINPKINMNIVKFVSTIICRRALEKIQISFGRSLGSCPVPRRISKAAVYFSAVTSWPNWKIPFRHGRTFSRLLYSCIGTWALPNYLSCRLYRVSFTLSILPSNLNIRFQVL